MTDEAGYLNARAELALLMANAFRIPLWMITPNRLLRPLLDLWRDAAMGCCP